MNYQAFLELISMDTFLIDSIFISLYLILTLIYIKSRKAFIPLVLSITIGVPLFFVTKYAEVFESIDHMWRFYFIMTILDFGAFSVVTSSYIDLRKRTGFYIKFGCASLMVASFFSLVETAFNIERNTISDIFYKVITPLAHILIIFNLFRIGEKCVKGLPDSGLPRDSVGNKSNTSNSRGLP